MARYYWDEILNVFMKQEGRELYVLYEYKINEKQLWVDLNTALKEGVIRK